MAGIAAINDRCNFQYTNALEDLRLGVSATIMKTNCIQVHQSIRPNRTALCMGTNMKKYAACEHCMDHSLHSRLHEHMFEVANALLTVSRASHNLAGITAIKNYRRSQRELLNSLEELLR